MARQSEADREREEREAMDAARKRSAAREAMAESWRGKQFAQQGFAPEATLALVAWKTDHHETASLLKAGKTHTQIVFTYCPLDAELPVEDDVDEFIASTVPVVAGISDSEYAAAHPTDTPAPPSPDSWRDYHGGA